jgi:ABC-type multidrug transport system fused ATPase/permease subunit
VLLLDEPTAALDPETELSLSETLRSLFQHELKGRTAIVITHRAALARIADQVVTLEGGQLRVEENVRS